MRTPDSIYEEIKRKIINLDLLPGTKIREEDLADEYNMSRTPIRGVISRLVKDSLLEVAPKKGTYVSKIDVSNINDYIYVRKSVEESVLVLVCNKITQQQIIELEEILHMQKDIMKMEPSINKSKMFFHNDNYFHAKLFNIANLDGVWHIIHTNAIPLNRARIMANLRSNPEVEKIYEQHQIMLECIRNKDVDGAKKAASKHMEDGFEGIHEIVKKYNEYFI